MSYQSIDQLQKVLAHDVFHYAKDAKKASGRALGTMVEIITFYLLKSWGFQNSITIEKAIPEYGNPEITHNVEYSLHPILREYQTTLPIITPVTAARILSGIDGSLFSWHGFNKSGMSLLTKEMILRNSCIIAKSPQSHLMASLLSANENQFIIDILEHYTKPYAMFECKRVGIEETSGKGPQTIEKAKQGAYVAGAVSALRKIRLPSGELRGIIYTTDTEFRSMPYPALLAEIITSHSPELLHDFILTVGVVSNHGNWFTSENHNKELKVLAQSYDWLLFLTDEGLTEFIRDLLLFPSPTLIPVRTAFLASYSAEKKKNQFTKVQMDFKADQILQSYFRSNFSRIANWFNIITPTQSTIEELKVQLAQLRAKNWREIHAL